MNHIMIDGYYGSESRLDDLKTVNSVLNDIVIKLNLTSIMPPYLLPYYYAKDGEDDGISAFTLLEGGHITIHTFPHRGCLFVDLLYDGYFDEDKLRSILRSSFNYSGNDEKCVRTERRFLDTSIDDNKIWNGEKNVEDFGPHIIARIEDVDITFEQIFDILDEMPQNINMLPICRPFVAKGDGYISGIVLIAQSHIAFHYCVEEKTLFCDLFSCSFYDIYNFTNYLEERFGEFEFMTLIRGSKHENKIFNRGRKIRQYGKWMHNTSKGEKNGL